MIRWKRRRRTTIMSCNSNEDFVTSRDTFEEARFSGRERYAFLFSEFHSAG